LLKLGFEVSQATVGRYLPWRPKAPSPTWRSFLHNHRHETAVVDMFVVTATFQLLYALVVLGHERRKVIHFDVTPKSHSSLAGVNRAIVQGDVPSPINRPSGCHFHTRCPYAIERSRIEAPPLVEVAPGHLVSCHLRGAS
jgi:oligopeptide/dipeptide ABC transporter ATP-binding protein